MPLFGEFDDIRPNCKLDDATGIYSCKPEFIKGERTFQVKDGRQVAIRLNENGSATIVDDGGLTIRQTDALCKSMDALKHKGLL